MTTLTKAQLQDSIAKQATETRADLVSALTGIDKIIALATTAGRTDIVKAAQAVKSSTREAAEKFNAEVKKTDGDSTKMNPIVVEEANKAADTAQTELRGLYNKLKEQVDGIDENVKGIKDNIKLWGFGTKRNQDGLPIPKKDSWAAAVEENLTDLDNSNAAWGFGTERDAAGKTIPVENTWAAWVTGTVTKHDEFLYGNPDQPDQPSVTSRLAALETEQPLLVGRVATLETGNHIVWLPAVIAFGIALLLFWILLGLGLGMVWAAGSASAAAIAGLVVFIFTNRTNNRPAR